MRKRPFVFGEVLFDHFPDGRRVLGGAPFNVAWHLEGLGASPVLISRVGRDEKGREILDAAEAWGLDTTAIQHDPEHATGAVDVRLRGGEPTFEILDDRAWDHVATAGLPDAADAALLYHGSLSTRTRESREALSTLFSAQRPRYVDVNLRAPFWNRDSVLGLVEGARWIKLNEGELGELLGEGRSLDDAARDLLDRTGGELVVVTRGRKGARAVRADGETTDVAPPPVLEVVDTVGAGDGFAAVTILGLLEKWPLPLLLERAQAFAGGIVGLRGATTSDRDFYLRYRNDWSDA
jgi:fructokinase